MLGIENGTLSELERTLGRLSRDVTRVHQFPRNS
jgi:hypothetical protein